METFLALLILSVLIIAACRHYRCNCIDENEEREELIANLASIDQDLDQLRKMSLFEKGLKCQGIPPGLNDLKIQIDSKQTEIEASVMDLSTAKTSDWPHQRQKAKRTWVTAKRLYRRINVNQTMT